MRGSVEICRSLSVRVAICLLATTVLHGPRLRQHQFRRCATPRFATLGDSRQPVSAKLNLASIEVQAGRFWQRTPSCHSKTEGGGSQTSATNRMTTNCNEPTIRHASSTQSPNLARCRSCRKAKNAEIGTQFTNFHNQKRQLRANCPPRTFLSYTSYHDNPSYHESQARKIASSVETGLSA